MSDFDILSNRDEYCYAIELALDGAAMEADLATNETGTKITITNTSKEDIMFNINKCNINVNGHQCKRNRTSGCTMEINGELIYTCRQHYTQYSTALVVNIPVYHFTNIKPVQEDNTMKSNIRTREQIVEELNYAKKQMEEMREHPYTNFAIAYGDAVGDRIDMLTAELKEFDEQTITNQKEETMKTDIGIFTINHREKGYVKCVKCSKELPISDPENDWSRGAFHRSVDEVRLCMTGNLDKPIETGFVVAKIWTGKQGDKMQTQYFNVKDRKLAVEFAKEVSGTMKTTKTGSIQVTYKLS